jgi:hypothetical protein
MSTRSRGSGPFYLPRLLDALAGIEYIIVGGVAGTLHGSPRVTFDLAIVPDSDIPNVERLSRAVMQLAATIREHGERRLPLTPQLLADSAASAVGGQVRLRTMYGPLDVLWRLHDGRGYRELAPHSVLLSDTEREVRVLQVSALIEIKEAIGRPRDLEDAGYLRAILRRSD